MSAEPRRWFEALALVPGPEKYAPADNEVCIALGSNVGDRLRNIQRGIDFVASLERAEGTLRLSSLYESQPVGCPPGSEPFYNAVAVFECELPTGELLARLKKFEERTGRNLGAERNSPRPLDMDIIYHGSRTSVEPALTLPHPRATERRFVLLPLAELRPHLLLPGQEMTVVQLLGTMDNGERLRRVANPPR